jgi:AraC family transcriptional regulator of adaptative response/methylated-DNA-[protein]-cysteine methyltransferase
VFFVAVRTTGIFCRPSCPSRRPRPENVEYFATPGAALYAGYRACKRCRPLDTDGRQPAWVRSLLGRVEAEPQRRITDRDLRRLGLEPPTVRRYFLKTFGVTFHAYARARRIGTALRQIKQGADLDEVVLGHGFDSHSGFRAAFGRTVGRPPGRSQEVGMVTISWFESPVGPLIAGATDEKVCLLEYTDRRMLEAQLDTVRRRFRAAVVPGTSPVLDHLKAELGEYFEGRRRDFTVPLTYPGTGFQVKVWDALRRIPYGETRSYQDMAVAVGSPRAVRAVGRANGLNRIAIVIPCHRVVNKDGKLGGYGGGLWRKQLLLDLERSGLPRREAAPGRQLELIRAG